MTDLNTYEEIDAAAVSLMDARPDLKQMSLDEWVLTHADALTDAEKHQAERIIKAYFDI